MKEKQDVFDQLDLAYEPTTEAFHRRVQETLIQMKTESAQARPIKRIQWAAVLAAALMLFSAPISKSSMRFAVCVAASAR